MFYATESRPVTLYSLHPELCTGDKNCKATETAKRHEESNEQYEGNNQAHRKEHATFKLNFPSTGLAYVTAKPKLLHLHNLTN